MCASARQQEYEARTFFEHVGSEALSVAMELPRNRTYPDVLAVHGGGPGGKAYVEHLTRPLASLGYGTLRFDHAGVGESSGMLAHNTLAERVSQCLHFGRYFEDGTPRALLGTSMGGHVVAYLCETWQVESLILFCPAAYTPNAHTLPFGDGFSTAIRRPDSWRDSHVFDILGNYSGRSLLCVGEQDTVIPPGVLDAYRDALSICSDFSELKLPGPHRLHDWLPDQPVHSDEVMRALMKVLA